MQVFYTHLIFFQIFGQILRHLLGQGCDQNLVLFLCFFMNFREQVINLSLCGTYFNFRVQEAGRSDNLLCTEKFVLFFVFAGSGGDKEHLVDFGFEFRKV